MSKFDNLVYKVMEMRIEHRLSDEAVNILFEGVLRF